MNKSRNSTPELDFPFLYGPFFCTNTPRHRITVFMTIRIDCFESNYLHKNRQRFSVTSAVVIKSISYTGKHKYVTRNEDGNSLFTDWFYTEWILLWNTPYI